MAAAILQIQQHTGARMLVITLTSVLPRQLQLDAHNGGGVKGDPLLVQLALLLLGRLHMLLATEVEEVEFARIGPQELNGRARLGCLTQQGDALSTRLEG